MTATAWLSSSVRAAAIERRLRPGQALFHAGSRTAGLYQVVSGSVQLVRTDRSGREAVLQVASAGDTLAEASLFSSTYHCDAVATTEAIVRLYPKAVLLAELQGDPKIAKAFAAMLAHQIMSLRTRLERWNIHSARDRVRHFLALNVGADRRTVALSGTLKELAADLGLTHEALYPDPSPYGGGRRNPTDWQHYQDWAGYVIRIIWWASIPGYEVSKGQ